MSKPEFSQFVGFLQQRLRQPLPGLDVQMTMSPPIRKRNEPIAPDARLSAVLMLLYPHEGRWLLPFMRRAQDGRVHGGQISLPGGKQDPEDPDVRYTALRETEEEFGIPREQPQWLGPLTEIYIPPSKFLVYPQLAVMQERPAFYPDTREVDAIIEVELSQFLDPTRKGWHRVDVFRGQVIEAPGYTVNGGELIWGGTAMMLAELAELLREWQQGHMFC